MFVLAIAVLIAQHFGRGMRLITADAKGNTDVAELCADVAVNGA